MHGPLADREEPRGLDLRSGSRQLGHVKNCLPKATFLLGIAFAVLVIDLLRLLLHRQLAEFLEKVFCVFANVSAGINLLCSPGDAVLRPDAGLTALRHGPAARAVAGTNRCKVASAHA